LFRKSSGNWALVVIFAIKTKKFLIEKKGFHTLKTPIEDAYEPCEKAAKACPVKIISVKSI